MRCENGMGRKDNPLISTTADPSRKQDRSALLVSVRQFRCHQLAVSTIRGLLPGIPAHGPHEPSFQNWEVKFHRNGNAICIQY